MKKTILLIALFESLFVSAQVKSTEKDIAPTNHHSIYLDLVGFQYKFEKTLSERYTISLNTGVKTTYFTYGKSFNYISGYNEGVYYSIAPYLGVEGRYYYPLAKIEYPASNFVALEARCYFPPLLNKNGYTNSMVFVSPYWGIYRSFSDIWRFELDLGLNAGIDSKSKFLLSPKVDLKIGVVF